MQRPIAPIERVCIIHGRTPNCFSPLLTGPSITGRCVSHNNLWYVQSMPRRPSFTRRWLTAATWPVGISLTSWDYMWRTTVMHRRELAERDAGPHLPLPYPAAVDASEVQSVDDGVGPLFHRRYSARIKGAELGPEELIATIKRDLNAAAPTTFARFQRVLGDGDTLGTGDEYVVRMPGPWDGPV